MTAASQKLSLIAGPLSAIGIWLFADPVPQQPQIGLMLGILSWMAIWWMTEAVPLAVTSLLPVVLLPATGIADARITAAQYMDSILFLFIGGFMIAIAIERWNLHKRISLKILMWMGARPDKILFGVMFSAWLMSMWISNTATVMMLLTAVMALSARMQQEVKDPSFNKALLLGLAYASSIGGMATLVGTPTNMIFIRTHQTSFPDAEPIHFSSWMIMALPVSTGFLFFAYFILRKMFLPKNLITDIPRDFFKKEYDALGAMTYEEKAVGVIFALTAVLWITRADFETGNFVIKGWSSLFEQPQFLSDGAVAVAMAILLFLIPSTAERGRNLLNWQEAERLPFGIILLFGGGFAIAMGVQESGMSEWLAGALHFASGWHPFLFLLGLVAFVSILTEFTSNMSSIQLLIPVLIPLSGVLQTDPLFLMIPATIAASMCFMLPVATAPNTIVFGTGQLRVPDMIRAGIWINLAGIFLISLYMYFRR